MTSKGQRAKSPEFVTIGEVLAPWGIKGEIKVKALTDFPQRFLPGSQVYLEGRPFTIERSRPSKGNLLLKLATIEDATAARKLCGHYLEIPHSQILPLPEGQYYTFQLLGLEVWTTGGERVGELVEVLPTGSNDVYLVRGRRGEVLLPAIQEVVRSVDVEGGRMIIEPLEGLLEEDPREGAGAGSEGS